jgi:hypothetical protein
MIVVDRQERLTHKVIINDTTAVNVERMCTWCHSQFGKRFSIVDRPVWRPTYGRDGRDGVWQCLWTGLNSSTRYTAGYEFSFDHEQDAVLFALRWS